LPELLVQLWWVRRLCGRRSRWQDSRKGPAFPRCENLAKKVIFFPSRPGYVDPAVTRRVLDYMLFMNSKVLFKQVRAGLPLRPVPCYPLRPAPCSTMLPLISAQLPGAGPSDGTQCCTLQPSARVCP